MALVSVGTTPKLLLNSSAARKRVKIQMQPSSIDSANTGKVFVAAGHQPVATVGHNLQGEILIQGAAINRPEAGEELQEEWKLNIWAVSDTASQSLIVEEELESPKK